MSMAVAIESQPSLRAEFVERIKGYWHKSRANILALGRTLIEARQKLSADEFNGMVERDLPFGYDNARRFMRIASDPRLTNFATSQIPESANALDELRKLNDEQFEAAIASGDVHEAMTVQDARAIARRYLAPAPYAIEPKQHRPQAVVTVEPPADGVARCYGQLVALLTARRHELGIAQEKLDDLAGFQDGYTGKLERPEADAGRSAVHPTFDLWLGGLRVGLKVVAL